MEYLILIISLVALILSIVSLTVALMLLVEIKNW